MAEEMIGNFRPDSFGKFDDPILSSASIHGFIVFPINISSIKVVISDKLSEFVATSDRIFT